MTPNEDDEADRLTCHFFCLRRKIASRRLPLIAALTAESGYWGTDHKLYLNVRFELRQLAIHRYLANGLSWP